jgi:hypothetical protein
MMSGIASGSWSLVNFLLLRTIGDGLLGIPGLGWMNGRQWAEIFWLIAVLPAIGIAMWIFLSRKDQDPKLGPA